MSDGAACLWKQSPLGDLIADLRYGTSATCDAAPTFGVPVLRIPNVVGGKIDLLDLKYTIPTDDDRVRYGVAANDILLVRTNGNPVNIGRSALVRAECGPLMYASYLIRIRCKEEVILPDFLQAVLQSRSTRASLVKSATTSAGNYNINAASLRRLEIPLPPLDDQRRIAKVLQSADEAIAKNTAVLGQLKTAYDSTMSAFLNAGNDLDDGVSLDGWITGRVKAVRQIPSEWRLARLIEVAKLESGHTPSRSVEAYWQDGDIGWISLHDTKNLERIEIQETALKITAAGVANSSARMLPRGTVCLSRTATVGKCVIMGKAMTTSQDFANFVCSPALNNRYLLHLFRWMGPIWQALSSGSTHKTIYMPTFEALQIVLPPIGAQESVATALDAIAASIEHSFKHLKSLYALRQSISSDLLSGRVRVSA